MFAAIDARKSTASNTQTGSSNSGQTQDTAAATPSQQIDKPYKPKFHKAALYHQISSSSSNGVEVSIASPAKEMENNPLNAAAASPASTATSTNASSSPSSNLSLQPMVISHFIN